MRRLRKHFGKLRRLGWRERVALLQAGVLLVPVRLALVVLPFRSVLRMADRVGRTRALSSRYSPDDENARLHRIVWAVKVVGNRIFPGNPCLTQALVVHALYRRSGRHADLRIGVRREPGAALEAHAWVESSGEVVIGGADSSHNYTPLPPLSSLPHDPADILRA